MKFYKLADLPSRKEAERLGFAHDPKSLITAQRLAKPHLRGVLLGETRKPRKGDWYLSGAIPEAYKANADLSSEYPILRLVRVEVVTEERIVGELWSTIPNWKNMPVLWEKRDG